MQRIIVLSNDDIQALVADKIVVCTLKDGSQLNLMSEEKFDEQMSSIHHQTGGNNDNA